MHNDEEGKWAEIHMFTPTGGWSKTYINKGYFLKQQRTEALTKKMHRAITTLLPDAPPHRIFKDLMQGT
eukprot:7200889-Karenia_brevis.AAC.1